MTFSEIISTLLIGPLKLIFETIFIVSNRILDNPALAIVVLSLTMNLLVLPLYRRADAMQEEARDIEAKLRDGVKHIKATFKGDERMMILQEYYRQNNYKPTDALRGSVSLLLEIPFFIAAYQFLSHLALLNGVSLGPIADLGMPDNLIRLGSLNLNLLPLLMTTINIISGAVYLRGYPLKSKIQLYGIAGVFLVFLYNSPSGLVFYWTLNNIFSLVKNLFYKIKNPRRVLAVLMTAAGFFAVVYSMFFMPTGPYKRKFLILCIGLLLMMPSVFSFFKTKLCISTPSFLKLSQPNKTSFILGSILLTVMTGLFIPLNFIADCPQEYVYISYYHHPLWHVAHSLCYSAGTFIIWFGVFYSLANPLWKSIFDRLIWMACGAAIVDYMFFGTKLGVISSKLRYENGFTFSERDLILNIAVLLFAAVIMFIIYQLTANKKIVPTILGAAILALSVISCKNMAVTRAAVNADNFSDIAASGIPTFTLSTAGNNVIVIMLDRCAGEFVPYLMEEKPELQKQFDGFTWYPNTISFGGITNIGTPPLLGGYEYTPVEMNKRDTEDLKDKHNEALLSMPVLFSENGYKVTVCDPPYANYQWIPDLSIYDAYPGINAYRSEEKFIDPVNAIAEIAATSRNFFCFSLMKTMPLFIQPTLYNNGMYNRAVMTTDPAYGLDNLPPATYNALQSLSEITSAENGSEDTYLFFLSNLIHNGASLQTPDYVPSDSPDNTKYHESHKKRYSISGESIELDPDNMQAYDTEMAAFLLLGKWFDYLREHGVYDNTRIIITSDHGNTIPYLNDEDKDAHIYNTPLLMFKDFGDAGITISDDFMTNADVPLLSVRGLIDDPCNPFSGKPLSDTEKTAHDQFISESRDWNIIQNGGKTFNASRWRSVHDNVQDINCWNYYDEDTVLKEHRFPE